MSKFRKQHMSIDWHEIINDDSDLPAIKASLREKASLVGRLGSMMLSVGTSAWRVRASMNKISRALGIDCVADIGLMSIEYTCIENGETYTSALSLSNTGINTDKLNELENFADGFNERAGKYSIAQFHRILDKFQEMPANYKAINLALASALACCGFTFLLGGGIVEMILAFFGAGMGQFVRKKLIERHITLLANVTAAVAAACTTYVSLMKLAEALFDLSAVHQAGYICSMLFIIPGFPLITGGIDLAKLDIRSGLERLTYALLIITMATLTGSMMAWIFRYHPSEFKEQELSDALKCLFRMICSFCGVYGFSFLFNSRRRMAVCAGFIGMIANTLRLELIDFTEIPVPAAAFVGALTAGLLASLLKKHIGYPRITLTVPSIVIMVPGMFMYKGIYYLGCSDIATGSLWLCKAALIVMALPLGLIFARILTDRNFRKSS
ncbi:MAG: threonine/serine exporter family protein [Ruminococcus sp.]|nr:threonine/serine exporter family protein [Ruminococcus sp.]